MALLMVVTVLQGFNIQCKEYRGAGRDAGFIAAEGEIDSEHKSTGNQASLVLLFPLTMN